MGGMHVEDTVISVDERRHFDELLLNGTLLVLTFSTGLVDAASVLALGHVFTANMTGNVVFMAFASAGVPEYSMTRSAIALLSALAGGALAGHMDRRIKWKRRNDWLAASLAIEAFLLTLALCLDYVGRGKAIHSQILDTVIVLVGCAMGIRNGAVRRLALPDLTTTVLTLTVAGLAFDSRITGGNNIRWRRRAGSILMMFAGAVSGAILLRHSLTLVLGGAAFTAAFCAAVQVMRNETEHEGNLDIK
jgi:uncharacterized membrane protein YoaK (UPF0700 family)